MPNQGQKQEQGGNHAYKEGEGYPGRKKKPVVLVEFFDTHPNKLQAISGLLIQLLGHFGESIHKFEIEFPRAYEEDPGALSNTTPGEFSSQSPGSREDG